MRKQVTKFAIDYFVRLVKSSPKKKGTFESLMTVTRLIIIFHICNQMKGLVVSLMNYAFKAYKTSLTELASDREEN